MHETPSGEVRISGQMQAAGGAPVPPVFATPYRSFGGLIAAVLCVGIFLGIVAGGLVTAVVTHGQFDAVVEKLEARDEALATRLTRVEESARHYEANSTHIREDIAAILAKFTAEERKSRP